MKKSLCFKAFAAFVITIGISACSATLESEYQLESSWRERASVRPYTVVLTATIEPTVDTKTAMSGYQVVWKTGDQIKVYNESHPDGVLFTLESSCDGLAEGTFTGSIDGSGPYYAVYPASAATGSLAAGEVGLTIPQVQTLAGDSFGSGANVAFAKVDAISDPMTFKNILGAVEINLSAAISVTGIRIQTKAAEPLWGEATVSMAGDTPTLTMAPGTVDNQLIKLDGSVSSNKFYLMLPPETLASGFILQVFSGGLAMFSTGSANINNKIVRSGIVQMPALTFSGKIQSSFLDTTGALGYYENIAPSGVISSFAFAKSSFQYATKSRYFRLQSMSLGKMYEFTIAADPVLGGVSSVTVNSLIGATANSATEDYVLVQKTTDALWFVSKADQQKGVIFKTED